MSPSADHDVSRVTVETRLGAVHGTMRGGAIRFQGVPYAQPPTGARRLRTPDPIEPWSRPVDGTGPAPIAPQLESRLSGVMGDFDRAQSEDCLTVTITTPGVAGTLRPVIVWLHGGGFVSGAGSLDWYDGGALASADVVVVGVNSRLGALGFLVAEGVASGNLGLADQALALDFVRANIADFGGDPDNITLMGQSAGGSAIVALYTAGLVPDGISRAVILSGALGMAPQALDEAERIGAGYLRRLGIVQGTRSARQQILALPTSALLRAQHETMIAEADARTAGPPFQIVADGGMLPREGVFAGPSSDRPPLEMIIGTTRDEMTAFFHSDPEVQQLDEARLRSRVRSWYGDAGDARLERVERLFPTSTPGELLTALSTEDEFLCDSLRLADAVSCTGRAFVYRFDWCPPGSALRSCHCIELPFVFGTDQSWADAPMLAGADPHEMAAISASMQAFVTSFARSGTPIASGSPDWLPYDPLHRKTMMFTGDGIRVVDDPSHLTRTTPPHRVHRIETS